MIVAGPANDIDKNSKLFKCQVGAINDIIQGTHYEQIWRKSEENLKITIQAYLNCKNIDAAEQDKWVFF